MVAASAAQARRDRGRSQRRPSAPAFRPLRAVVDRVAAGVEAAAAAAAAVVVEAAGGEPAHTHAALQLRPRNFHAETQEVAEIPEASASLVETRSLTEPVLNGALPALHVGRSFVTA